MIKAFLIFALVTLLWKRPTWHMLKDFIYQNVLAWDCALNALSGGYHRESYSSRCHRCNNRRPFSWIEKIVDVMFYPFQGWGHCKNAYLKGLRGVGLPEDYMEMAWAMNEARKCRYLLSNGCCSPQLAYRSH